MEEALMQKRAVIGLDVGGTKVACGLFSESGQILHQRTLPTVQGSAQESVVQLVCMIDECVAKTPVDMAAAGVGIVIPGWINREARTVWAPNISGWDHLGLEQLLVERISIPIVMDSDRSAYVKGETWMGAARGLRDVVFLAVGTGIGAGILSDGRILHGHHDLAGAVGWLALSPRFQPVYQAMGCFEAEASGNSIGRKGRERLGLPGKEGKPIQAREVIEEARAGNQEAEEILDEALFFLGMGVANLVSTLDPEMIVLGGGLFQDGTYLLERIRIEFARWAQPIAARRVRIELSTLGDRAGLYGAARIALDTI